MEDCLLFPVALCIRTYACGATTTLYFQFPYWTLGGYGDNCKWKGIARGWVAAISVISVDYMQGVLLLFCNNLFA